MKRQQYNRQTARQAKPQRETQAQVRKAMIDEIAKKIIEKVMKPKIHIASCSFGKDSIATILLALENNEPLDRVVFSEVMFDISRNISGEDPMHINWIYSTAIPKLEKMGAKVDIVRADTDYIYWFHHIPNGKYKGKKEGFLIGGMCKLNSMCKVKPIKQYYKQFADCELVKYIGIAVDEPKRLKRLRGGGNFVVSKIWVHRANGDGTLPKI